MFIQEKRNIYIVITITYMPCIIYLPFSFAAKGERPCQTDCCKPEPDSANSHYILSWWWLMNILVAAHIFSGLVLSPLKMPSPSISYAMSPRISSECHQTLSAKNVSSSNSIKNNNTDKDVRWKNDRLITATPSL